MNSATAGLAAIASKLVLAVIGDGQRGDLELVLSVQVEDGPAGDEEGEIWRAGHELGDCGHRSQEVLEIVQHDELVT
ncbi:MAG: hypothetical protein WKF58_08560 [Ilumatobacteraceae bacterium]